MGRVKNETFHPLFLKKSLIFNTQFFRYQYFMLQIFK